MVVRPEDLARTLVSRAKRRREIAEGRAAHARKATVEVLASALSSGRCTGAWLIGSLAWGGAHQRSDVDVVVAGLPPEEVAKLWDEISEAAGVEVDLLRIEELDEGFRRRVVSEGTRIDVT